MTNFMVIIRFLIHDALSPSGNVVTGTGADAGPSPTMVLAATVMLNLENLRRPV